MRDALLSRLFMLIRLKNLTKWMLYYALSLKKLIQYQSIFLYLIHIKVENTSLSHREGQFAFKQPAIARIWFG